MDLYLHFGAGLNQLPEPWLNLGPTHDIRKHLKFESDAAAAIVAEHVIEHIPFLQALGFFRECLRVLRPGGVLRVAFPDVGRFLVSDDAGVALNAASLAYGDFLADRPGIELPEAPRARARAALERLLTGWGHQTPWTEQAAAGALLVAGFSRVARRDYGHGDLAGIDGHHVDVGRDLALLESTILEAVK
ncbi:MAG TPA: methyltransferase domain-containing protein [Polyangiaceae bacterium]|nr:methyltransferase domain-containing protein [Polyangiaceae bacterium]